MPIYSYACSCGLAMDEMRTVDARDECPTCSCGLAMERRIGTFNWAWAGWAMPGNEDANRAQREWIDLPETRARLDSGELSLGTDSGRSSGPVAPTADQIYDDMMRAAAQGSRDPARDLGLLETADV